MRRALLASLLLLLGACSHLPIALIVPDGVLEELERTRYGAAFDAAALAQRVRERYGAAVQPLPRLDPQWRRLDREELPPLDVDSFDRPDAPGLAGLRSGDLVLAKNPRPQSLVSSLTMEEPGWFDHMGILVLDEGSATVIECWPRVAFLAKPPDFAGRFRGGVARRPLSVFAARYEHLSFLRLSGGREGGERLARRALDSLGEGIRFDPYHVPDDAALSCTEYVHYLLDGVLSERDELVKSHVRPQPSIERVRRELGWRAQRFLVADAFLRLRGARPVGDLARHSSRSELLALQAARIELHARAGDPGAPLGDWVAPDGWSLFSYGERTAVYHAWSKGLARVRPSEEPEVVQTRARELFEWVFGLPEGRRE